MLTGKGGQMVDFINYLDALPRVTSYPNVNLLIRPRGFGQTLFASTAEQLLMREGLSLTAESLAEGLPRIPVIKINLTSERAASAAELNARLLAVVRHEQWEEHIERQYATEPTPKIALLNLIHDAAQKYGAEVVILIDGYDGPFTATAALGPKEQEEAATAYLDMLNAIVQCEGEVKWALLLGHTKFRLASETSDGIPLLNDVSYSRACATTFGLTVAELKRLFASEIRQFSPYQGLLQRELVEALRTCYGGFAFSDGAEEVLCPLSVYRALSSEGMLYPYASAGNFSFIQGALDAADPSLNWLYGKDGQDPLFLSYVSMHPEDKEIGSLLLQNGFASIDKVSADPGGLAWRYRFAMPNVEMRRIFRVLTRQSSPALLRAPINPRVPHAGERDFDL